MHRLFVAFRPPAAARARLAALSFPLPGARWQADDQLHCTLRFIGEVDAHRADDIAAALGSVRAAALDLAAEGWGEFDRKGRLDTLWAGLSPREPLLRLHRKIDRALVRAGLEPERRAFVPHVTVARFGRGAPPPGTLRPSLYPPVALAVSAWGLYESRLGREGSSYQEVVRYRLDQAPAASSSLATIGK